ncbi:MAG: dihydroneopterin aldolase [Brevundimonas sp.]|nr:MAG: dihydroneopterin aldolase [Brevundimonas sp.]
MTTHSAFPTWADGVRMEALTVFVRGLTVAAGIGVHEHEHGRLQTLVIDADLELAPNRVERLSDTVNYELVSKAAQGIVEAGHVGLVETFAERLAVACLVQDHVRRVRVRIGKPGALGGTAEPGCEVVLSKG